MNALNIVVVALALFSKKKYSAFVHVSLSDPTKISVNVFGSIWSVFGSHLALGLRQTFENFLEKTTSVLRLRKKLTTFTQK